MIVRGPAGLTPTLEIDIVDAAAFQRAFGVSRETMDRFAVYERLLRLWQKSINLVSASTLDEVWPRHFADSAQIVALAPVNLKTWVDIGSGGGFPGLVVALLLADRGVLAKVTLIESDVRKCAFLREVARQTGLLTVLGGGVAVDILTVRVETAAIHAKVGAVDVVSARALAPLERLLSLSAGLFGRDTTGLFLKGREAAREVEAASRTWAFDAKMVESRSGGGGEIVVVRSLAARTG